LERVDLLVDPLFLLVQGCEPVRLVSFQLNNANSSVGEGLVKLGEIPIYRGPLPNTSGRPQGPPLRFRYWQG